MSKSNGAENSLKWWQLSLFGVGSTIGTGFFLGSSISIIKSGPAVLFLFIIAALGTYLVFDGLARMTAAEPLEGAFRSYAKKAFGAWAGFTSGWVYWSSEMLIMGSQLTALSIFTRFWFPDVPLWIFASFYATLGLIVILFGAKGVNRFENIFALIKIAAILMFIIIALAAIMGLFNVSKPIYVPNTMEKILPFSIVQVWSALLLVFYAFGGVEVTGLMAAQLNNPEEAPKAGKVMVGLITTIYLISITLAVIMVKQGEFSVEESPFVTALKNYHFPYVEHIFNAALIIAGFSTMVAALYGVTTVLVTLAKDGDAPKVFAKKGNLKVPTLTFILSMFGLLASIILSLLMPDTIYEYITTAAGLMLLFNWLFILLSARKLLPGTAMKNVKYILGMIIILLAVFGTLFNDSSRPGFFISIGFVTIIVIILFIRGKVSKKDKQGSENDSLFKKL